MEVVGTREINSGLVIRLNPVPGRIGARRWTGAEIEVQAIDEGGFPLLTMTLRLGGDRGAEGSAFGLLYDYSDPWDLKLFEGLARQNRLPLYLVDGEGVPLADALLPLTLWNRVQVYQALEVATKIHRGRHGPVRSFVLARARWSARQRHGLGSAVVGPAPKDGSAGTGTRAISTR